MSLTKRDSALISTLNDSDQCENYMDTDVPFDAEDPCDHTRKMQSIGVVSVEYEDNHGGEGEGSDYYSIYRFNFEDGEKIYVKFQGWYASYHGSEFESCFIVEPKEVTVVQYFEKDK